MNSLNKAITEFACRIAEEIKARAILLYADVASDLVMVEDKETCFDTILVTRGDAEIPEDFKNSGKVLNVPDINLTRVGQIKIAITKGIATGLFKKGDKLVCLTGIQKFGYVDSIMIIDVGKEFEIFTSEKITDITESVSPEVFNAVLNIALELAAQGREGRPVGTIFILGDHEKVLQLSRQITINPFVGYKEEKLNILSPGLKETIKEFSAIDGAFVVKDDGVLVTAGRHLSAALENKDFPKGLGSRHIAAAGITSATQAIAIVVSESTGTVSVLKNGKIFVGIEKPVK
ncbi:MAG: diadenylate cyclase [Thermodesulfobacteriota bacterium]|nr:diadenylate cyclase [Thermodesulfobacteriota bacterium]